MPPAGGGCPSLAGGTLSIYGSIIDQHGVLRAPIGTINLGWDGTGTGPVDPITGKAFAATQQLTLAAGSVTSVSAVDPLSGQGDADPLWNQSQWHFVDRSDWHGYYGQRCAGQDGEPCGGEDLRSGPFLD